VLTIVDVDADRWDDLAELMGERGDSSRCWCQYYRSDGRYEHDSRERNRAAMHNQVTTASVPHGVLAYEDARPVGWCAVAPRGDYPRLKSMQAARNSAHTGCATCETTFLGDYFGEDVGPGAHGLVDYTTFVSTYADPTNPEHRQQQIVANIPVP
jgi:hypothetical protein